jgi:hypothetical protein
MSVEFQPPSPKVGDELTITVKDDSLSPTKGVLNVKFKVNANVKESDAVQNGNYSVKTTVPNIIGGAQVSVTYRSTDPEKILGYIIIGQ